MRTCPNCGSALMLYTSKNEYRDEDTLIVSEYYECPNCGILPKKRTVVYKFEREDWNE